jgi:hypothetical protein
MSSLISVCSTLAALVVVARQRAIGRTKLGRLSNGEQVHRVAGLAMKAKASPDFTGYWQRHVEAK